MYAFFCFAGFLSAFLGLRARFLPVGLWRLSRLLADLARLPRISFFLGFHGFLRLSLVLFGCFLLLDNYFFVSLFFVFEFVLIRSEIFLILEGLMVVYLSNPFLIFIFFKK